MRMVVVLPEPLGYEAVDGAGGDGEGEVIDSGVGAKEFGHLVDFNGGSGRHKKSV